MQLRLFPQTDDGPSRARGVVAGERAGLLASVFVVSYLAFSLPAIAAGVAAGHIGLARTVQIYGAVVIVLALTAAAALLLRRRPAPPAALTRKNRETLAA